jgi:hypothetical protein
MMTVRKAVLFAVVASLAACSENTMSPRLESSNEDAYIHRGGASQTLTAADTFRFQIEIDPKHNTTWDLGEGNSISFPRNSYCDPYKSTYGVGEWDKPCTVAKTAFKVNVTVWLENGHPRVDFEPGLRFVPSTNSREWVIMTFQDLEASLNPLFSVNYCPSINSRCYDESKLDPTVATMRDPKNGKVTRRIKHFSGYNVAAGEEGDSSSVAAISVSSATTLFATVHSSRENAQYAGAIANLMVPVAFVRKKSGYILASG